ncbi:hypothetical protein LTR64_000911 [Lithohypha guttulata]|uniref:uncharacterized protein n=1 Tax=Lithohypha guttulata TaxID=1690604 RepID=UPI002DE11EFF|nr:hypothetical protein LTR51_003105 [Lithohypha guttulata]
MPSNLTAQQALDAGAIRQPADAPNAKQPGQKCLTCTKYDSSCYGSEVRDGKCNRCRGLLDGEQPDEHGRGKQGRKRTCVWLDPARGIQTYEEAQQKLNMLRNTKNTAEARAERAEAEVSCDNVAELPVNSPELNLVGRVVHGLIQSEHYVPQDSETNYRTMFEALDVMAATEPGPALRRVYDILSTMQGRGDRFEKVEMFSLLHGAHAWAKLSQ